MQAVRETNFTLPGQTGFYRGKVRDVYSLGDKVAMVASDRISAFDVVLPEPIPMKGTVLNQLAVRNLEATRDICPNWLISSPDPQVSIGWRAETVPVEMVIRGYLVGHAWREYSSGKRTICGVAMPDGMVENQKFPQPLITPTTKAAEGHDQDISREEILAQGQVAEAVYLEMEAYTRALFKRGTQMAAERGLILVDTKYEFGLRDGQVILIDEIHTADSSRYFYADGYEQRLASGERQKQLSKEFVREWLMAGGFQGKEGQTVPEMTPQVVAGITERYLELYRQLAGEDLAQPNHSENPIARIERNLLAALR